MGEAELQKNSSVEDVEQIDSRPTTVGFSDRPTTGMSDIPSVDMELFKIDFDNDTNLADFAADDIAVQVGLACSPLAVPGDIAVQVLHGEESDVTPEERISQWQKKVQNLNKEYDKAQALDTYFWV